MGQGSSHVAGRFEAVGVDDRQVFEGDVGAVAQVERGHAPVVRPAIGVAAPGVAGLAVGEHYALFALAFQDALVGLAVDEDFLAVGAVFRYTVRRLVAAAGRLLSAAWMVRKSPEPSAATVTCRACSGPTARVADSKQHAQQEQEVFHRVWYRGNE